MDGRPLADWRRAHTHPMFWPSIRHLYPPPFPKSQHHRPQVKVAVETLRNPTRYAELLKGPKGKTPGQEATTKGAFGLCCG